MACHTFLATWSTCHRLNLLPNLATLVVASLLATFFVADTLCLSLVVAKLVMNEVQPWSLLDSTCGRIWWNVDDIQRPVVLGFAIFVPSDWLHPTTNFQSYGLFCSLRLPRLSLGMPQVCLVAFSSQHSCSLFMHAQLNTPLHVCSLHACF